MRVRTWTQRQKRNIRRQTERGILFLYCTSFNWRIEAVVARSRPILVQFATPHAPLSKHGRPKAAETLFICANNKTSHRICRLLMLGFQVIVIDLSTTVRTIRDHRSRTAVLLLHFRTLLHTHIIVCKKSIIQITKF